jgi:gentisate 1,2-dioxygenase
MNGQRPTDRLTLDALQDLRDAIGENNVSPFWEISEDLFSKEPTAPFRPLVWNGDKIISLLVEVGKRTVPGAEVGRRVLTLIHPDIKQFGGASWNLQIGFQLVKKGERAPPHTHNAQASRFVIEGTAATVVEGERINMEPGDYVLTPAWHFHEHLLDEGDYILWLDTLDIPFITRQGIAFFKDYPSEWMEIAKKKEEITRRATQKSLIPWIGNKRDPAAPFVYKWNDCYPILKDLAERDLLSDYDGARMSYVNPVSSKQSVYPTFGADITLMKSGTKTKSHRHTAAVVYYIVEGKGHTIINGKRYDWKKHDVVSIPPWAWHEHVNTGEGDAVRLMLSDQPLLENLGMYLEEPAEVQS